MRVIGMGVCGPNEKYLEQTLEEFKRLCDETVICLCNATPKERALVLKYGFHIVEDSREWGRNQWAIKEDLLKLHVAKLRPDWIIALDMDEVFEEKFTRLELEKLAQKGGIGYYFYVVNLYNEGYSREWSFWNVRMFRWAPEYGLEYERKAVHPGLAPRVAYFNGNYAPFLLKHYGLKDKEDRDRKVERYQKYDPKAQYKGRAYYEFLASEAPVAEYDEEALHNEVANEVANYHFKNPKPMTEVTEKFVLVKRLVDGKVLDVPFKHLKETLARGGFELISNEEITREQVSTPVPEQPKEERHICQICGFEAKSKIGLIGHARKHQ